MVRVRVQKGPDVIFAALEAEANFKATAELRKAISDVVAGREGMGAVGDALETSAWVR